MKWGFFSLTHISTLLLAVVITVGLYYLLRKASHNVQIAVLGVLSLSGIAAILFNLFKWGSPIEYLPLHLCSLTALILPFAVLTRNRIICNLSLLWSLGAILAVVVNNAQAEYEIFSLTFLFYYFPHVLEFAIPVLLFKLKLAKKDVKTIGWTVVITMSVFTLIHWANLWLNAYCVEKQLMDWAGNIVQVNYMYSIFPENPVMQVCYNLLPVPYWYMWLLLPVILIYLCLLYIPQLRQLYRERKQRKCPIAANGG
jgi:uncharacterized membrane protein YwaF